MIPYLNNSLQAELEFGELPTNTYKLHILKENITGFTDELQAMAQAIYLMLNIERYTCLIYSWNYGIEFSDLIGQPVSYCLPEIKRRITETLIQDTRITAVDDFSFEQEKGKVHAAFTVHTVFGDISTDKEVAI